VGAAAVAFRADGAGASLTPVIRAAIVDDEALARERLRELLGAVDDVEIVAECADGRGAVETLRAVRPALLFLDVQMPALDGFGVLGALGPAERPPAVVFVTAYDQYALRAFEVNAMDYVLKPYTRERLNAVLERARARLLEPAGERIARFEALLAAVAARDAVPERIAVRSRDAVELVRVAEIDWIRSDGNYCVLSLGKTPVRTRATISELETRLRPAGFLRVHRSYLVNTERIHRIEPWAGGEYVVVLRDGTKINTGRGYGEAIRDLFA
jgi:two-component system LytT family response regulator